MIFLVRSGINKHLQIFSKTTNCKLTNFVSLGKKIICAYLFQIEIIWLPIQKNRFHVAVSLYNNRTQETSEYDKNVGDTLGYASFWCHLWSTAEQKHVDMEYTCS